MTDIVEIVSGRLRDGRSIGDAYAKDMLEEITRLRAKVAKADALADWFDLWLESGDTPEESDPNHLRAAMLALAAYRGADT